jgi:hypothetical protein
MFRPKDDISVWKQQKGLAPEYFTVYFDDEYICGFDASQSIDYAILEFWKGFLGFLYNPCRRGSCLGR